MRLLEEMSWPQIEEGLGRTRTVILPVGATEEHGPHLPVFTDTLEALEVAKAVAERRDVFVAPALAYGVCRSTRGFPGTITVDHDALREFVRCLLVSFHENGFAGVLILTGHAGGQHLCALEEACQAALDASTLSVSLVSLFDLIDPRAVETPGDGHSGEIETSLMMHIAGGLVSGLPEGHFPDRPRFLIQRSVRHLMGDGIMGDPARASPDKGRAFFEMAVEGVIRALDELESALARPWSGP